VVLFCVDQNALTYLAHADDAIGHRAEAEKIFRDLERKSKQIDVSPYVMATTYAGLGDREKAFEFLEKAYQLRDLDLSVLLGADLRLDNLHSDPRFQNLLNRLGLPN